MSKLLTIIPALALGLACVVVPQAGMQPRELEVRPAVELATVMGVAADILGACVTESPENGPVVVLHYQELTPPGLQTLPFVLKVQAPATSTPSQVADCIRSELLKAGGTELPASDTTDSESGSDTTGGDIPMSTSGTTG